MSVSQKLKNISFVISKLKLHVYVPVLVGTAVVVDVGVVLVVVGGVAGVGVEVIVCDTLVGVVGGVGKRVMLVHNHCITEFSILCLVSSCTIYSFDSNVLGRCVSISNIVKTDDGDICKPRLYLCGIESNIHTCLG